jgi:transcriptional regulator with XRE-family HTH domain
MQGFSEKSHPPLYDRGMARPEAHPFGQLMSKHRQERGMSQAELGLRVGVSRGMIAYYESCAKNPTLEFIEKVAATFDVSVNDLVGSGGERKRKPGPASRIEQLAEELTKLPKTKQRLIVQMLEGFLHAS